MKTPLDDLNEEDLIKEYEEESKKSPLKRQVTILIIALFLIGLMSSYVYLGFPVFGMLFGLITSSTVDNDVLTVGNVTVVFQEDTLQQASQAYYNNPEVETTLCMLGSREGNVFYLKDSYQPVIRSQSYTHVTHEPCNENTILLFHTHPYNHCSASGTDIRTLERAKEKNEKVGMLIMCNPNRFSVYT